MAVLVIAEHSHGALSDATHKVVTAAAKFGGDVDVLVAGENAGAVAPEAAKISGVRKVLKAEGESLRKQTAEAMEALVVPLMAGAGWETPYGREQRARIEAGAPQVGFKHEGRDCLQEPRDCQRVQGEGPSGWLPSCRGAASGVI